MILNSYDPPGHQTGGLLLKMVKYFGVMLNIFWIFQRQRNCRILIGLYKYVYIIMFFDRDNKTKLVPASFSYFLDLFEKKMIFSLKVY